MLPPLVSAPLLLKVSDCVALAGAPSAVPVELVKKPMVTVLLAKTESVIEIR